MDHRTLMGHGNISDESLNSILLLFKEHAEKLYDLPSFWTILIYLIYYKAKYIQILVW